MSIIESEYSRHKVVIKDGTTQLCSGVLRRGTALSYEMKAPIEDGFQRASIIGPKGAGLVSKIPYVGGIMSLFLMQNPCIQYEKEYQYSGHVAQKFKVSFIVFNDEKTGLEQLLRYILPHKGSQAEALEVAKVVSEILSAISYDIRIKNEADDSSIVARIKNAVRATEAYKSIEQFLSSEGLSDHVLKSSRELNESLIAFVSAKDTLDNTCGGGCTNECVNGCTNSCYNKCSNSCGTTCGDCTGCCTDSCAGQCIRGCDLGCFDSCKTDC